MKALVTGAAGQLGLELTRVFGQDGEVVALPRARLDICDHEAVLHVTRETRPDVILNCAAYNDVDGAETDPGAAMQVNGFGVRSLAAAARETGAVLVHYGTDFVFDGHGTTPYREDHPTAPLSVYGRTKLLGLLSAGDPRGEVKAMWHAKQVVRSIYEHRDPDLALEFVERLGRDLQDEDHPIEAHQLAALDVQRLRDTTDRTV